MATSLKTIATLAVLIFCCTPIGQAGAETRGISIPPGSIVVQGTATVSSLVNLPNTALPSMFVSFVLPPDYQVDSTVKVLIYMQEASGACDAVLDVISSTRRRNGFAATNTGGGIQPAGNNPVVSFSGSGIVKAKLYNVKPPIGGVIGGIQPGDAITIRLDRLVDDPADNCASTLFMAGAAVQYESAP